MLKICIKRPIELSICKTLFTTLSCLKIRMRYFCFKFTVYLFIETCLCLKDPLSARNNNVTNGMNDSLLMLRLARACLNLAMLTSFLGVWHILCSEILLDG